MNDEVRRQAIAHVLEQTKSKNYRRHIKEDVIAFIVRDAIDVLEKWTGPNRSDPISEAADALKETSGAQTEG